MLSSPLNETFIHRQTTAGQVRFTTVELSGLETKILNAGNHAQDLERRHFEDLRQTVLNHADSQIHAIMGVTPGASISQDNGGAYQNTISSKMEKSWIMLRSVDFLRKLVIHPFKLITGQIFPEHCL